MTSGSGMRDGDDRFLRFLISERASHTKRSRFAALMAILIGILLYQTQWLILRPGLSILLAGQAGVVLFLMLRNAKLSKDLDRGKISDTEEVSVPVWFEGEEAFIKRVAVFENACQAIGFVTLGYEIWVATGSLLLALAIAVVYPATAYFGITRGRNLKAIRRLRTEKEKLAISEYVRARD